jgi:crossover junction endodeoxyribonuclease RuvC
MILGIDQGMASCGFCCMDYTKNIAFLDFVKTTAQTQEYDRAQAIQQKVKELIETYNVKEVRIEMLFANKDNPNATMLANISTGIIYGVALQYNIPVIKIQPRVVKKNICGNLNASKEDVIQAVNQKFELAIKKSQDHIADSVAIAYTHFMSETNISA